MESLSDFKPAWGRGRLRPAAIASAVLNTKDECSRTHALAPLYGVAVAVAFRSATRSVVLAAGQAASGSRGRCCSCSRAKCWTVGPQTGGSPAGCGVALSRHEGSGAPGVL